MTSAFTNSRFANFRQKKPGLDGQTEFKLTLPEDNDRPAYEPTATFNNTRTSMRMLKGRIQRGAVQGQKPVSNPVIQPASNNNIVITQKKKLSIQQQPAEGLKLILNDSPLIQKKKFQQPTKQPEKKRILITKQQSQPPVQKQQEVKKQTQPPSPPPKMQEIPINKHQIQEEQVQQSKDQAENQNDLVQCPQGCGRKFNRKALEKHAKACKTVFMSKRKQFNSQAKRFTSKQQASIVRQNKIRQKSQMGKTKGQGQFGKTGDNWKAASEDFRAALKGIKKNQGEQGQEQQKVVTCTFCEKIFNEVFFQKHVQNCVKRKEKEKKSAAKKKR